MSGSPLRLANFEPWRRARERLERLAAELLYQDPYISKCIREVRILSKDIALSILSEICLVLLALAQRFL